MGLSSTQVSEDDQMFDWSNTLQQPAPGEAEPPEEPPYTRRQKRPQKQETMPPLKCPRCDSTNTKFCYYNNYNKSQPRHLCKTCNRHWTNGGTLRNVPIGGSHKKKRLKTTNITTGTTNSATTSMAPPVIQDTEFLSMSLRSFGCNSLVNLSSYDQSLSGYNNYKMHTMEGSTITTAIPSMNASSELEIPNYWNWNWNEIDELTSTHDLNLDWYDTEIIKP